MKIPRFSNAIGNLDEDLVEAAAECKKKQNHCRSGSYIHVGKPFIPKHSWT